MKMKLMLMLVALLAFTVSCTEDKLKVIHNNDRVADLEQRMALNEQLDSVQSDLISLNASAIGALASRVADLEDRADAFESALQTEMLLREQGDETLDDKISTIQSLLVIQGLIDIGLQWQINVLNSKIVTANAKIATLKSRVDDHDTDIQALQQEVSLLTGEVDDLRNDLGNSNLEISNLYLVADGLETRIQALELTDPVPGPQGPQGIPGVVGPQGPQGPQGIPGNNGTTVSLTTVALSGSPSCKSIGDNRWAKRDGAQIHLYDDNDCGSHDYVLTLDPTPQSGQYASFWLTATKLLLPSGSSSADLKILSF